MDSGPGEFILGFIIGALVTALCCSSCVIDIHGERVVSDAKEHKSFTLTKQEQLEGEYLKALGYQVTKGVNDKLVYTYTESRPTVENK